jgi:DNA-nicking Smr family endonuclease
VSRQRKPDDPAAATEEEAALFAREMAGVRPLPGARAPRLPAGPVAARPGTGGARSAAPPPLTELECHPGDWAYVAHDAGPNLLRELRRGQRPPAATLDLHGLTAPEAERALGTFVSEAQQASRRVILVVHGRGHRSGPGGPVLGDLVRTRLATGVLAARVLAFCQAPPALGGAGATVILLRKR